MSKKSFRILIATGCMIAFLANLGVAQTQSEYTKLVFNDEFEGASGSAVDATKWTSETGGWGWGNQELQYYTTSTENAFHEGQLDENWYNNKIDTIERQCKEMIAAKGLQIKPTSGNWAIFGYMKQPIPYNNNQPCIYDIDNFTSKNPQSQFVYTLLKTKKGTCHSLPLLYLLLAQELKAEAYLVSAPMHLFIKHRDQYGEWWNLELTGGGYSRTSFIVESFQITDKQMESGFYMKAWNTKQTLAYFLEDLNNYYEEKTGIYYDDFRLKVAELGLKYLPASQHLLAKADVIKYKLDKDMAKVGLNDYSKITPYPKLVKQQQNYLALKNQIAATGYKPVSEEWYKGMVKKAFETNSTKK